MRHPYCVSLSGWLLCAAIASAPSLALAQTPEPAAGNPAINGIPAPDAARSPMASPSSEAQIPKGSNPDSGSGNLAAGSGATPPAQAFESAGSPGAMPQTANNPDGDGNAAQPGSQPEFNAARQIRFAADERLTQ